MTKSTPYEKPYQVHFRYEPILRLSRISLEWPTLESALPIISHTLLRKILALTDQRHGVHLFVNYRMSEFDVLTATLGCALSNLKGETRFHRCRYADGRPAWESDKAQPLPLRGYPLGSSDNLREFLTRTDLILDDVPTQDCWHLFEPIRDAVSAAADSPEMSSRQKEHLQTMAQEFSSLEQARSALITRFDLDEYNLGIFFAWGEVTEPLELCDDRNVQCEHLEAWRMDLLTTLQVRHSFQPTAYLPSFARSEDRSAILLFVDIRGFTAATEMARFTGRSAAVVKFLGELIEEFTEVVKTREGRIEKMTGDGLVAVFGEYDADGLRGCGCALAAATEMYDKFRKIRDEFMGQVYGPQYRTQFNENIEIELGISLNYGTVTFGYFGAPPITEYVAVGDHANFGSRLSDEAGCYDDDLQRARAPILVSQTVFSILDEPRVNERPSRDWFKAHVDSQSAAEEFGGSSLRLQIRGKGHPCNAYELWPQQFVVSAFSQWYDANKDKN